MIVKNTAQSRYEMSIEGQLALVTYRHGPDRIIYLIHTEVPQALAGQGVGSRLAKGVLDTVRSEGLSVVAECPFLVSYMARHPEYQDLTASNSG